MMSTGKLNEIKDRNVLIVVFGPELKQIDELNVMSLGDKLLDVVAKKLPHPLLVLDMSVTEFFGSSFIEILFRVWKRLSARPGAHLALVGLQPYCQEVIKVTHLDQLWDVYDTHQSASNALNQIVAKS